MRNKKDRGRHLFEQVSLILSLFARTSLFDDYLALVEIYELRFRLRFRSFRRNPVRTDAGIERKRFNFHEKSA